ncbi:hypothetical protein [Caballeronia mineralivorans]|jgi:hypothetical protein|uniref:hypothetical protein n=1 Tax=Caballeronia mineralivorans TaxID=2010198 RepID=UPI0023F35B97|nr:hypothetical protein [Caballeronia mineralivorans]MDB5787356.1 hypothetical protein [Caballeronia mineralivorans]
MDVRIAIEQSVDDALLTLVDNDIGMTAEFIPAIFDIFAQVERLLDRGSKFVVRLPALPRGTARLKNRSTWRSMLLRRSALRASWWWRQCRWTGKRRRPVADGRPRRADRATAQAPCAASKSSGPTWCCRISARLRWTAARSLAACAQCPASKTP